MKLFILAFYLISISLSQETTKIEVAQSDIQFEFKDHPQGPYFKVFDVHMN